MKTLNRTSKFFQQVYFWMFLGLILSAVTALIVVSSPALTNLIFSNMLIFIGLIVLELILVVSITGMIHKLPLNMSRTLFLFYSCLNGVTISIILLFYTATSIAVTFFIAASMFGILAIWAFFTDTDISKLGPILFMALIGIIIAMIVNFFLKSSALMYVISVIGVVVFSALTAYDNQRLKQLSIEIKDPKQLPRYSILGALRLYLDFINLFLFLLRLFGKRR